MRRVVLLREPERARAQVEALVAAGVEAVAVPMARIAWVLGEPPAPLEALVFTSVNGVLGLERCLDEAGVRLPRPGRIAAVGPATAVEAERVFGRPPDLVGDGGARTLAALLLARGETGTWGWPCARDALPDLALALAGSAIRLEPWVVYASEPLLPSEIRETLASAAPWDAVVVPAPSAALGLLAAWPRPWPFRVLALGARAAEPLLAAGVDVEIAADPVAALLG